MFRSVFSNWMALLVSGVVYLLLTPVLVGELGAFQYSLWILVTSISSYYGLLDMGMRTTFQRFAARFHGRGDRDALNETLATALIISLAASLLTAVGALILSVFLPDWFAIEHSERALLSNVVLLYGFGVALSFPARVLGAYLCGLQRFDLYNLALIATTILQAVVIVMALQLGYGLLGVAAASVGIAITGNLLNWRLTRRADPAIHFGLNRASRARAGELAKFGIYAFLNSIGFHLRHYTDSLVIGYFMAISLIASFNIPARLMEQFRKILFAVTSPLMSEMSRLDAQSRHSELKELFLRSTRFTSLLTVFIASVLFLDGKSFLRWWIGEDFTSSYPILLVLIVGYVAALSQSPSQMLMYAQGKHRALAWWTLGEGVGNLLLSIYLVQQYGLMGVAIGTTLPMLFTKTLLQPAYTLRLVRISPHEYLRHAILPPFITGGIFLVVAGGLVSFDGNGRFLGLLLAVSWQAPLYWLIAYFVGFTRSDRLLVFSYLRILRSLGTTGRIIPTGSPYPHEGTVSPPVGRGEAEAVDRS